MSDTANWGTDDGETYDVQKFYTRSDKQTKQMRVYIPLDQIAAMEQLVQGKEISEIRTLQDIVRDALHHRLHFYEKERVQTPESAQRQRLMQIKADSENERRQILENKAIVEEIANELAEIHAGGDGKKLMDRVGTLEVSVDVFPKTLHGAMWDLLMKYGSTGPERD